MKRILVVVIALALLGTGGIYFTAETVVLPKQEKVWRDLLTDLPYGLKADFKDVEFDFVGQRLSIGGATISDGRGNSIKISEIVAENSLSTALGNLVRFVFGREEERYDVVRFIGVEPLRPDLGVTLEIKELRLIDVAIGIDNKLPSTIKALTGAINLEKAFSTATVGGYEIHGVTADIQGVLGQLEMMRVHGITRYNIGLVEIHGLNVVRGGLSLASLEMFRTSNFNIASMMEPAQAMSGLGAREPKPQVVPGKVDLSEFNIFHLADEFVIVGLDMGIDGFGGLSIKRFMYKEEAVERVASAGLVPTRTFSEVRDFSLQFPALAMVSADIALFMDVTGISGFELDSQGDSSWDLASGTYISSGRSELADLVRLSTDYELGNFRPEDVISAMAWSAGMTNVEGGPLSLLKPQNLVQSFQSGRDIYGPISLANFGYFIENMSLVERLYRYGEVAFGIPEADMKAFIDGQLQAAQDDPALPASQIENVLALRAFVANPASLRITVSPPKPVAIDTLIEESDAERTLEMLGLTITANEALKAGAAL